MRTSAVGRYALRLTFGQILESKKIWKTVPNQAFNIPTAAETSSSLTATGSHDRVISRSATCLALLGIALSSFSLKQMLASSSSTSPRVPFRKF